MTAAPGTRLLERGDAGPLLVLRKAVLSVTGGPDAGRALEIDRTTIRVGSDACSDFVLADDTVSGQHLEIETTEAGSVVRDLGSTNGTFVGGRRVKEAFLADGDDIVIGHTTLQFALATGDVEISLSRATNFGGLLGHGPLMRAAFAVLERAAKSDVTVLVCGESGTGKELAARGLHDRSARREGPYVVLDCGAAAPTLVESLLFGHARGAFSGATDARVGVFEEADGGTLVLDELGELPLELQPKLLRALESKSIVRVGENKPRSVDVRFVASTNRNLEEEVRAGRFREDLFFRVSVITVRLPSLRERRDEIPRLVRHLLAKLGRPDAPVTPAVMDVLLAHAWPGNVRELRNFVERLVVLGDLGPDAQLGLAGQMRPPESAGPTGHDGVRAPIPVDKPFHEAKREWTEQLERVYLARLLELHRGNVSEVARAAGLSRMTCYRLMQKHGLRGDE